MHECFFPSKAGKWRIRRQGGGSFHLTLAPDLGPLCMGLGDLSEHRTGIDGPRVSMSILVYRMGSHGARVVATRERKHG